MDNAQTAFIVDDDRDFLNTACRWLESVNIPVKAFDSAVEFLGEFQPNDSGCLLLDRRGMVRVGLGARPQQSGISDYEGLSGWLRQWACGYYGVESRW